MTHRRHLLTAGLTAAASWVSGAACHGQTWQRSATDILAESSYAWKTDSTTHVRIHYLDRSPAADSLQRLKRDIEVSWTKAADFVGAARIDPRMIDVFAVPTREMVREISHVPTNAPALNFWEKRVIIIWVPPSGWRNPHEIVHIMAYDTWGEANAWWLGEGVAIAGSDWFGVDVDVAAKCLDGARRLVPLDAAVRGGTPDDRMQNVVGAEAGSFVRFLIEHAGRDKLGRVYASGAGALPTTYGEPLTQLEREWREHLDGVGTAGVSCEAVVNAAR